MATDENHEEICLAASHITKIYPGTRALDEVDFGIRKGKVNVLIGENGAGKSTLMKIISGVEQPTSGEIRLNGELIQLPDTRAAVRHGIGIIHQELNLFPNLTVAQNLFITREHTRYGVINHKQHIMKTRDILAKLKHVVPPETYVSELRVGTQQIVEIAKTMSQENLQILIMDEPTSALSSAEVEVLFSLIRELTAQGIAIVYISHRMDEIMSIGDYVTVLRDGKLVGEAKVRDIDLPWIVHRMVGKTDKTPVLNYDKKIDKEVLKVDSLTLPRQGGGFTLDHVSLHLRKGEILGVYGLLGAGRTELLECLMGVRSFSAGSVYVNGKKVKVKSIDAQISRGFALVPEDRQREGLIRSLSIERNLSLINLWKYTLGINVRNKILKKDVQKMVAELSIKVSDTSLPIESLSGGNQQKVVIGKWILTHPEILLLDEPTRGIDVNAKSEVFQLIQQLAAEGLGIIVVDSELKEITDISDRVMVLSKGRVTGEFEGSEITEEALVSVAARQHAVEAVDTIR